jgi:hypothetical protein
MCIDVPLRYLFQLDSTQPHGTELHGRHDWAVTAYTGHCDTTFLYDAQPRLGRMACPHPVVNGREEILIPYAVESGVFQWTTTLTCNS